MTAAALADAEDELQNIVTFLVAIALEIESSGFLRNSILQDPPDDAVLKCSRKSGGGHQT